MTQCGMRQEADTQRLVSKRELEMESEHEGSFRDDIDGA